MWGLSGKGQMGRSYVRVTLGRSDGTIRCGGWNGEGHMGGSDVVDDMGRVRWEDQMWQMTWGGSDGRIRCGG